MKYGVVLFYTSSAAIRSEKLLTQAGMTVRLIPTPRQLSSDCGIALRFEAAQQLKVERLLSQARVETAGIHILNE